jgi:hypothetical protein
MSPSKPNVAEWAAIYRDLMLALGPIGARVGDEDPDFVKAAWAMERFHDLLMALRRAEGGSEEAG